MSRRAVMVAIVGLGAGLAAVGQEPAAPVPERLFAIVFRTGPAWDAAKPPNEQAHMKDHSANLAEMRKAGTIVLGARYADVGLMVARAASAADVEKLLARDPSIAAGIFRVEVHPWSTVYDGCLSPRTPR
jgi:uncharacterized protein YciI